MFRVSCFLILAWAAFAGDAAFSAENSPKAPMAPPTAQAKKIPENPFRCDRQIKYRGKLLPCDSALRRDGESLRSIFEKTPDALDELDQYQSGRRAVQYAAYTGTTGLVLALAGGLIANIVIPEERAGDRQELTRVFRYSGFGLALGSVVFGLSHLRSNEDHLQRAIIKYNASQPDRPIQVLFQTDF
jgi:hypothetical protein